MLPTAPKMAGAEHPGWSSGSVHALGLVVVSIRSPEDGLQRMESLPRRPEGLGLA